MTALKANRPYVNDDCRNPYKLFGNRMLAAERSEARRYVISNLHGNLTHTEFVTLTAICDRTLLFGKYFECIPQKHILRGLGSDYGDNQPYPISRKSLSLALTSLQERGYIFKLEARFHDTWPAFYGINFLYSIQATLLASNCFTALLEGVELGGLVIDTKIWMESNLPEDYLDAISAIYMRRASERAARIAAEDAQDDLRPLALGRRSNWKALKALEGLE